MAILQYNFVHLDPAESTSEAILEITHASEAMQSQLLDMIDDFCCRYDIDEKNPQHITVYGGTKAIELLAEELQEIVLKLNFLENCLASSPNS